MYGYSVAENSECYASVKFYDSDIMTYPSSCLLTLNPFTELSGQTHRRYPEISKKFVTALTTLEMRTTNNKTTKLLHFTTQEDNIIPHYAAVGWVKSSELLGADGITDLPNLVEGTYPEVKNTPVRKHSNKSVDKCPEKKNDSGQTLLHNMGDNKGLYKPSLSFKRKRSTPISAPLKRTNSGLGLMSTKKRRLQAQKKENEGANPSDDKKVSNQSKPMRRKQLGVRRPKIFEPSELAQKGNVESSSIQKATKGKGQASTKKTTKLGARKPKVMTATELANKGTISEKKPLKRRRTTAANVDISSIDFKNLHSTNKLGSLTVPQLRAFCKQNKVSPLPKRKADFVAKVAEFLDKQK